MSADLIVQIADLVEELAEPHQHTATSRVWDGARNAKPRRHVTVQDGLLRQLHDAVMPAAAGMDGGHRHPGSRPPLALEAMSKHVEITIAVTRWCWDLRVALRDAVESNLLSLVGAIAQPQVSEPAQHALLRDLRRWRSWCAVMTGWEQVAAPRGVPCPVVECGRVGTLRINLTTKSAYCRSTERDDTGELVCGAFWDESSIGVLADYIRSAGTVAVA